MNLPQNEQILLRLNFEFTECTSVDGKKISTLSQTNAVKMVQGVKNNKDSQRKTQKVI